MGSGHDRAGAIFIAPSNRPLRKLPNNTGTGRSRAPRRSRPNGIAERLAKALENAQEKEGQPVVLEVNLPEDWLLDRAEAGTYLSWRDIPPEYVKLVTLYVPPEEKYRLVRRTKRGSLITITRQGNEARLEITNLEDMNDISSLLNATGIVWGTESGISKPTWEGASPRSRISRGPESERLNIYPGRTVTFDFTELERIIGELGHDVSLLEF